MDLSTLNTPQKEAVVHMEGPLLLLAGAGSGKTRVLTYRIAHLIENGVAPFNILAITFTNKAAREMRERTNNITPQGDEVWVSTFHSTCVRILRRDINKIGYDNSFTIYDSDDSEKLIKLCIKELDINDKQYPAKAAMGVISNQKNELINPDEFTQDSSSDFRMRTFAKIYTLYQEKLKKNNALDFDDIIFRTVELFYFCPEVLEKYQQRFKYIMVDEYQDTNTAQYKMVGLLASKYRNLCVVGDDDQSIYGWRGANIRNILDFEKDFTGAKVIKLEQNYRSTKTILEAANKVINNNSQRKDKSLWTENISGEQIDFVCPGSDYEESSFVVSTIIKGHENGANYSDYAILYRNNALSRTIEDQLVRKNIPYRLFGGVKFYARKEVKDMLSYMRCIHNTFDNISMTRIINIPKRGIGDTTVDKIMDYATKYDLSFFDALSECHNIPSVSTRSGRINEFVSLISNLKKYAEEHTVTEVMEKIIEDTGILKELEVIGTEESQGRIENIQELINKCVEFETLVDEPTLGAFLEEIALVADVDNYTEDDDTVVLMTLHSAKGLEFPTVFITGFEESIFPSYRSITSGDFKDLEEERRLCYVGITRAKEKLFLMSAKSRMQYGKTVYNSPSRFVEELPPELINEVILKRPSLSEGTDNIISYGTNTNNSGNYRTSSDKIEGILNLSFGAKNYASKAELPTPKNVNLEFAVGDKVRQMKYGVGEVTDISPAGADYEVTVSFANGDVKKFMAALSKLKKVND